MLHWGLDDFAVGELVWAQIFSAVSGELLAVGLGKVVRREEPRRRSVLYASRSSLFLSFFDGDERVAFPGEDSLRKATKLDKYLAGIYD